MTQTILLADDSVTIQKVVELTFLDEDVKVVSVGNGSDAIAKLSEVEPDIVLADVHMPGADGYDVCMAVRRALPQVPVLLLVGTFEVFDTERATAAGASGHLKKPFDSQELLRRVREMMSAGAPPPPAAEEPAAEIDAGDWEALPDSDLAATAPELPGDTWSFEPAMTAAAEPQPEEIAPEPLSETEPEIVVAGAASETRATTPAAAEPVRMRAEAPAPASAGPLSDADVERIAKRVVELLSEKAVRDVAWEVVPDLAELLLKARIRELEASVE